MYPDVLFNYKSQKHIFLIIVSLIQMVVSSDTVYSKEREYNQQHEYIWWRIRIID